MKLKLFGEVSVGHVTSAEAKHFYRSPNSTTTLDKHTQVDYKLRIMLIYLSTHCALIDHEIFGIMIHSRPEPYSTLIR